MGRFVRNIQFTREFDGDRWSVTLKPMTHADAVRLLEVAGTADQSRVYSVAASMLPPYIVELSGGTDAAGQPITAEDVCSLAYFAPLVAQIVEEWMAKSMPGN